MPISEPQKHKSCDCVYCAHREMERHLAGLNPEKIQELVEAAEQSLEWLEKLSIRGEMVGSKSKLAPCDTRLRAALRAVKGETE